MKNRIFILFICLYKKYKKVSPFLQIILRTLHQIPSWIQRSGTKKSSPFSIFRLQISHEIFIISTNFVDSKRSLPRTDVESRTVHQKHTKDNHGTYTKQNAEKMKNTTSSQSEPGNKGFLTLVSLVVLFVLLDQLSKVIVRTTLVPGESISIIDGFFRITFIQNFKGFSWWIPAPPSWIRTAFFVLRIVVLLLTFPVYAFYTHVHRRSAWTNIACVGIAAGTLGNLLDDLFVPYTTDFIQFFNWPAPNLADIYAYTAVVALVVELAWFLKTNRPKWRGFRHYASFEKRVWQTFYDYLRNSLKRGRSR